MYIFVCFYSWPNGLTNFANNVLRKLIGILGVTLFKIVFPKCLLNSTGNAGHFSYSIYTGLSTKDETVKTTQNSKNMTIWSLIFCFCIQLSILMVFWKIKHRNKPVLAYKDPYMQEIGLNKFRTIFSEVSSFMGNPVYINRLSAK